MSTKENDTQPYTSDGRVIARKQGYSVIYRPHTTPTPFFCPVCDTALVTRDDEYCVETLECCFACAEKWAYPNLARWKEGWRPEVP